jgi:hypothetical protein
MATTATTTARSDADDGNRAGSGSAARKAAYPRLPSHQPPSPGQQLMTCLATRLQISTEIEARRWR